MTPRKDTIATPDDLPRRPRPHVLGAVAERKVKEVFPEEWIVERIPIDYGLDLEVQVVKNERVTGATFTIQVKGTDQQVKNGSISVHVQRRTLNYWGNRPERVMLVVYARRERLLLWTWADEIPIPDSETATVAVSRAKRLDETDWEVFSSRLQSFYKRRTDAYLEKLRAYEPPSRPSRFPFHAALTQVSAGDGKSPLGEVCVVNVHIDSVTIAIGGVPCGVVDCGQQSQREVLAWLDAHQARELSFVALSHLHYDHLAGLASVISALDRLQYLFLPPVSLFADSTGRLARVLHEVERLREAGTKIIFYSTQAQRLILQNDPLTAVDVFFPVNTAMSAGVAQTARDRESASRIDHNALCAVYRISVASSSFLVTGDASLKTWNELLPLLASPDGQSLARGLTLPHNGSRSAMTPEILGLLAGHRGFVAALQTMPANPYGLPHRDVLRWVQDLHGTLVACHERHASVRLTPSGLHLA